MAQKSYIGRDDDEVHFILDQHLLIWTF